MLLFSDNERLLEKLSQLGNQLERLDKTVNWTRFRLALNRIFGNKKKNPAKGGRPPYDYLMMFKILLLARLYNLSDEAMEYQLYDRLSFRRFVLTDQTTEFEYMGLVRPKIRILPIIGIEK